jgi:hypothetical protein
MRQKAHICNLWCICIYIAITAWLPSLSYAEWKQSKLDILVSFIQHSSSADSYERLSANTDAHWQSVNEYDGDYHIDLK